MRPSRPSRPPLLCACLALGLGLLPACADELPFGEAPPPDEECGPLQIYTTVATDPIEVGRLDGGAFVPLGPDEPLELHFGTEPAGWGVLLAFRYPSYFGALIGEQTFCASAFVEPGQRPLPGHRMNVVGSDAVSAAPIAVSFTEDLDTLLSPGPTPFSVRVVTIPSMGGYLAGQTAPLSLRLVNDEGFLAE